MPVPGSLEQLGASGVLMLETTTCTGGEVVVTAIGDVDLSSEPAFRNCLDEGLDLPSCRTLIVDLRGVLFLGTRGDSTLGHVREHADGHDVRLAVVADTRNVLLSTAASGVTVFPTLSAARAGTEA